MQLSITQAWASSHTFCVQIYELFLKLPNICWFLLRKNTQRVGSLQAKRPFGPSAAVHFTHWGRFFASKVSFRTERTQFGMSEIIRDTSLNLPKPLCTKEFREVRYVLDTSLTPHSYLTWHLSPHTFYLFPLTLPQVRYQVRYQVRSKWGLSEVSPRYLTCQTPFLQRHFKEFSEVCEVFIKTLPNSIQNRILIQNPHKHTHHHPHQTFPTVKSEFTLTKPWVYPI